MIEPTGSEGWVALGWAAARATLVLAAVGRLGRGRPSRALAWLAWGGLAVSLTALWPRTEIPYDFKRFWRLGRDVNAGVDYYARPADDPSDPVLNPPTIVPLCRLLALMPLPTAAAWWNAVQVVLGLGLVPAAAAALRAQQALLGERPCRDAVPDRSRESPTVSDRVLLAAALGVSCAQGMGTALGQVSVLVAFAIAMALRAQGLGRRFRAGVWLAIATIKVHTLLPFLVLFARRRDGVTWLSLMASCLVLCAVGGPLEDLPRRCQRTLAVIAATHRPGAVNDHTADGPSHASLMGFDPLLYRLGIDDRGLVVVVRCGLLAFSGAALAWAVIGRRLDRPTAFACVALYASVFLYHRLYDAVILAIPIVWAMSDRARWAVGGVCLAVWFVDPEGLRMVEAGVRHAGVTGWLVAAAMLPIATWGVLLAAAGILTLTGRFRAGTGSRVCCRTVEPRELGVNGLRGPRRPAWPVRRPEHRPRLGLAQPERGPR
ncbi:MAG: hypothetical protein KatS3mg108_2286 [Isosphaeraceae bacterium]|jgi:hypothetical protein|nr:MAG: hypothetical protein KatS3mg108_2286 [Isosphaeraceae bacterium]